MSSSRVIGAAFFVAIALAPNVAAADPAAADSLFKQAKTLLEEGKIGEACQKFEASYETDPALGALLNLADCLEKDTRFASAYGRWGEAVEIALRRGDERSDFARERRDAIKARLSFMTVNVTGKADDLDVYRGDTKLAPGAYGVELPTDAGETVIQVVRGDAVLWERKVALKETERVAVPIDLELIAKTHPTGAKRRTGTRQGGRGSGEPEDFWNGQRVAGISVMSLGLAGVGVGFALGGVALGKTGEIDTQCTDTEPRYCTAAGQDAVASAGTFADASTWTLIGSAIVTGVGLTVLLTAPSSSPGPLDERAERPGVELALLPVVGPHVVGLGISGRFE